MAVITTGNNPKLLWPGLNAIWGKAYNEHAEEWSELFTRNTSMQNYEEQVQATGFGLAPVKTQGNAGFYDQDIQGPVTRYVHVAYSLGFICTYEEIEDNLYMAKAGPRAKALAFSFRQTKERVAAGVFNRGFNTAYALADGQPFFSTAHPNTNGGTWANRLAIDADFSESALEDMIIGIMQATDDRGLLINLMPQSLHIAPANWFNANRVLKSVYQTGNANNDINVIKAENALPMGVKVNHYFTTPQAWFVKTNAPVGAQYFERNGISFTQENDFDTKNVKHLGYERYSFGITDPRCYWGSNGP